MATRDKINTILEAVNAMVDDDIEIVLLMSDGSELMAKYQGPGSDLLAMCASSFADVALDCGVTKEDFKQFALHAYDLEAEHRKDDEETPKAVLRRLGKRLMDLADDEV